MIPEKRVDESWKESVASEKEKQKGQTQGAPQAQPSPAVKDKARKDVKSNGSEEDLSFINYLTSLAYQAMVFLGEIPNPVANNKVETNLPQSKLLIDTLIMLREKTQGNLAKEEDDLLNSAIYELQMKYVEKTSGQKPK